MRCQRDTPSGITARIAQKPAKSRRLSAPATSRKISEGCDSHNSKAISPTAVNTFPEKATFRSIGGRGCAYVAEASLFRALSASRRLRSLSGWRKVKVCRSLDWLDQTQEFLQETRRLDVIGGIHYGSTRSWGCSPQGQLFGQLGPRTISMAPLAHVAPGKINATRLV